MRSIRAGMGLGDSLYLQGVVRNLVAKGERLEVCSQWPDVFRNHGDKVRVVPFRRNNVSICAHYSMRKGRAETNQWQDCCIQAGIPMNSPFRLDWMPVREMESKPFICVSLPRAPMDRKDGVGMSLLPDFQTMQAAIDRLRERYRIVQIGAGRSLHTFRGIDEDLSNKTSVGELIDVAAHASGFLGYCSFIVPLAESLGKKALIVWARRGLSDRHLYVRQIAPKKILSQPTSSWIMDDATEEQLNAACAFL